jgi:cyanate lyase
MAADEAGRAVAIVGLDEEVSCAVQQIPTKGALESKVPADPLNGRLREITMMRLWKV